MTQRSKAHSGSPFEQQFGFCRAIRDGNRILVAGTAPLGEDGKTVAPGNAAVQARRCFEIIQKAIEELGGTLDEVVRTRMFLTDISDWQAVGDVHGDFFSETQPVSTMVEVSGLIDPDWKVEFEAEAVVSGQPASA